MGHTSVTDVAVSGINTPEIVFYLLLFAFLGIFIYKLYKIFQVGENYDLPKIIITSILGILAYGLLLLLFIAEVPHLEFSYITMFRFASLLFIFFFIFIFIDLFIGMRRFAGNKAIKQGEQFMLQRTTKFKG